MHQAYAESQLFVDEPLVCRCHLKFPLQQLLTVPLLLLKEHLSQIQFTPIEYAHEYLKILFFQELVDMVAELNHVHAYIYENGLGMKEVGLC